MSNRAIERDVVEDFSEVIRRHRDQGPAALARLARDAFGAALHHQATRQTKVAMAMVRGLEARQKLIEAEGGSLSSEETGRLLGISKTAVLKRLESGNLLAWREERLQAARFPRWQFDAHGSVLKGLSEVLQTLAQNPRLDVWGKLLFFLQTRGGLSERRPVDLLREGKINEVLVAAAAYAE